MTLSLDQTQRLNVIAMLDRVECQGRRDAWAVCDLQKKLDLSDEERVLIGYKKMKTDEGREIVLWTNNGGIQLREFELSEDDVKHICNAVDKCPIVLGRDKSWWLPLTAQLPQPVESNGDKMMR